MCVHLSKELTELKAAEALEPELHAAVSCLTRVLGP